MDVAIHGDGFFEVQMPDGTRAYTRDGALKTDSTGRITTSDGLPLQGGFQPIPAGTTNINISPGRHGDHSRIRRETDVSGAIGALRKPGGLDSVGHNLIRRRALPHRGTRQRSGERYGELQQGYLELSNVKVVEKW
jgi:flagellar basal-body rod protein FlgG